MPDIREYWNDRAKTAAPTTDDVYLKELEVKTVVARLRKLGITSGRILDVGCGDGVSTRALATALPDVTVVGVDYATAMVDQANRGLTGPLQERVSFYDGDVLDLSRWRDFDAVVTMRCLINLPTDELQAKALGQIARCTKRYAILIENFIEGQDSLNRARMAIGLAPIPVRWHNHLFTEKRFKDTAWVDFDLIHRVDFCSAYYYATRVIYAKLCQLEGHEPDYQHPIHQLAIDLPSCGGDFSPIKMCVLEK